MLKKLKVGDYIYDTTRKVWTVRLEDTAIGESYFDCETQYEAEVLSRLVKLRRTEMNLEKVKQVQDKISKLLNNFLGKTIHPTLLELVKILIKTELEELTGK